MLIINIGACICGLVSLVLIKANFQFTFIFLLGFCLFLFAFIRQLGGFDFLYRNNGNSEKITDVDISPKENYLAKQMFNSGSIAEKFLATSGKHPARPNKREQDS